MTRRANPPMPSAPFGLLLVEGGDEQAVCRALADQAWSRLCCWSAAGRDLPALARLASNDPNYHRARAVGVILDSEENAAVATALAWETLTMLGATVPVAHGVLTARSPRLGYFMTPDGSSAGAIETLCRRAVRDHQLAACVDQLLACAGTPHIARVNSRVAEDKGWLRAYLGMLATPDLRFYQAFDHPQGIDATSAVFTPLRDFIIDVSRP